MLGFNLTVCVISITAALFNIYASYWIYNGESNSNISDDVKIFLTLIEFTKDAIFIYILLSYLLYGI